ncbi:HNH endonuclease signature motif containing protein [Jiangella gansuensis]|uniref:HNH endonuclease signature motif containing protein n=1 Tax=Jiangella gansuensis TaxID=281473 RepID=UPI00047D4EB5|nr:HNH endonuclease signature motif containing protein [Jiangella gansuensis]
MFDPRTGAWVSFEPWELPDDVTGCDLLPDGVLPDGLLDGLLDDDAGPADLDAPPGAALAGVLAGFDVAAADGYALVEATAGWARLAAWVAAKQATALAELASRPELRPADVGYRSVNPITNTAVEVAARTVTTTRQAENLVGHAVQLVEDFPSTLRELEAGRIDERRAKVITGELGGQEPPVRRRVEAAVLPIAPGLDSVALRRRIKELLHQLAPTETAERHALARQDRYVSITPASDGMAYLDALLPAADAAALDTALNAAADNQKRDDAAHGQPARTHQQRRADALAAMAWATLTTTAGPQRGATRSRPVAVQVTLPFTTLVGLDDQPGHLDGYGPIPGHVARELAAEGVWTWLRTDPATGRLLDHGTTRYRPSRRLTDFITARDRTCRMPGCHRPASRCDIDHVVAYAQGGATSADNCHCLCRTHHLLKHHGRWKPTQLPSGATVWRSPTGHAYTRPPDPIGPIITNAPDPPPF